MPRPRFAPGILVDGRYDGRSIVIVLSLGVVHLGGLAWAMALLR